MHLKQLKIVGFKSFVEPVIVPFSSQLIAVVGPNGCGKSNIVDAVRWVMGETSAKNLRGESMADVIFNGSTQRKPLGQASVELIFDNQLGRLGGAYAGYQEIAVKRVVFRDGESQYFLNGTRCRRRDITDIFLGTGAGARGYSMITQGTISRIVEARPEELRAYLEEAAGVSKYKERRKETWQRMTSTKDNLIRANDVSLELSKQLERLSRQADLAKKYVTLKQAEKQSRAYIFALKWQLLSQDRALLSQNIHSWSLDEAHHQSLAARASTEAIKLKEAIYQAQEVLNTIKTTYYQLGIEIARLEEMREQRTKDKARYVNEQHMLDTEYAAMSQAMADDTVMQQHVQVLLLQSQTRQVQLQKDYQHYQVVHQTLLDEELQRKKQWQDAQIAMTDINRDITVKRLRLEHLQDRASQIKLSIEKHHLGLQSYDVDALEQAYLAIKQQQLLWQEKVQDDRREIEFLQKQVAGLHQELLQADKLLHDTEDLLRRKETEKVFLMAKQNAAVCRVDESTDGLSLWRDNLRVLECIDVQKEWQAVVEWILGNKVQAIIVDSLEDILSNISVLNVPFAMFVENGVVTTRQDTLAIPRLLDMISGDIPRGFDMLQDIFAVNDLSAALNFRTYLSPHQSIVTPDGFWLGSGWMAVIHHEINADENLFAQKNKLSVLQADLDKIYAEKQRIQQHRHDCHQQWMVGHEALDAGKAKVFENERQQKEQETLLLRQYQQLEHARLQTQTLENALGELDCELEDNALQTIKDSASLDILLQEQTTREVSFHELVRSHEICQQAISEKLHALNMARQAFSECDVQTTKHQLHVETLQDSIARHIAQLQKIQERKDEIIKSLRDLEDPAQDITRLLDEKLRMHQDLQARQSEAQDVLHTYELAQEQQEQLIRQHTESVKKITEQIQAAKIKEEAVLVRMVSMEDALHDMSLIATDVLAEMTNTQSLEAYETHLLSILEKIKRLGAINLMAIEEYETEMQRKNHLDQQIQDLNEALSILETAITKLDKETETRFKETFDDVNSMFQSLFPRLFGGGCAKLELTCGNLLEAGVLVVAQPPGKRNGTIQLLSGGEKAMTAVALVFAIFKLNPSPFCLLDEVDAPLDEANVRRFCDLMREMSQYVQFLFVTHNKVTMELAEHLIGVTMREPGVSRVVAVDVEAALSMAQ